MKTSVRNIIKRMVLLMSVLMLVMACTSFVYAQSIATVSDTEVAEENTILPEEAAFEDEEVPLASVPGDEDGKVAITPFNILSAIGSYSLLIPALIVASVALIFAAIYKRKDKAETAKQ